MISLFKKNHASKNRKPPKIVFLHIPKTAGQSVHSELVRMMPEDSLSPVRVHTEVTKDAPQMPKGYSLYSGHIDWVELGTVPEPKFVFTVLRDPLERIASFYFYLKAQAKNLSAEELELPHRTGMRIISQESAEDYFFAGNKQWQHFIRDHYDNAQTTYLASRQVRGWASVNQLSQETLLDLAVKNAKYLHGIYSVSTLSDLETDLEKHLGARPSIVGKRVNAGPKISGKRWPELAELLGPDAAKQLEAYAEADKRLLDKLGKAG